MEQQHLAAGNVGTLQRDDRCPVDETLERLHRYVAVNGYELRNGTRELDVLPVTNTDGQRSSETACNTVSKSRLVRPPAKDVALVARIFHRRHAHYASPSRKRHPVHDLNVPPLDHLDDRSHVADDHVEAGRGTARSWYRPLTQAKAAGVADLQSLQVPAAGRTFLSQLNVP